MTTDNQDQKRTRWVQEDYTLKPDKMQSRIREAQTPKPQPQKDKK